jgi:hypothetical protein
MGTLINVFNPALMRRLLVVLMIRKNEPTDLLTIMPCISLHFCLLSYGIRE